MYQGDADFDMSNDHWIMLYRGTKWVVGTCFVSGSAARSIWNLGPDGIVQHYAKENPYPQDPVDNIRLTDYNGDVIEEYVLDGDGWNHDSLVKAPHVAAAPRNPSK
jgi:hypothetical protein